MDAKTLHSLHHQVENLLVDVGWLLRRHPKLVERAAALFLALKYQQAPEVSASATALFAAEVDYRHSKAPKQVQLPDDALGQFPFNKPTKHLHEQIRDIEAMLAPLSDRRGKAHALGLRLKGSKLPPVPGVEAPGGSS